MKYLIALGAVVLLLVPLSLMVLAGADGEQSSAVPSANAVPSRLAIDSIPANYLDDYLKAAATCPKLPWQVLAGIGQVETDQGRSNLPGVTSGANFAGAEGPMQFEPATFALFGTGPDQPLSPYDPADAIFTAARMLCSDGASSGTIQGIRAAVFAYNHAAWYVNEVLSWAEKYGVAGESTAAQAAISFALAQVGKPYVWGATGPDAFDCSGLVYEAYLHAGITIARTTFGWRQDGPRVPLNRLQPGDLLFSAGSDGTPSDPGHVVMYVGSGRIVQAPRTGEPVQVDRLSLSGVVVATRPAGTGPLQLPIISKIAKMRPARGVVKKTAKGTKRGTAHVTRPVHR